MLKIERFFRYGKFNIGEADFQLWNFDADKKQWLGEIVDQALFSPDMDVFFQNVKITIEIEEMLLQENE